MLPLTWMVCCAAPMTVARMHSRAGARGQAKAPLLIRPEALFPTASRDPPKERVSLPYTNSPTPPEKPQRRNFSVRLRPASARASQIRAWTSHLGRAQERPAPCSLPTAQFALPSRDLRFATGVQLGGPGTGHPVRALKCSRLCPWRATVRRYETPPYSRTFPRSATANLAVPPPISMLRTRHCRSADRATAPEPWAESNASKLWPALAQTKFAALRCQDVGDGPRVIPANRPRR